MLADPSLPDCPIVHASDAFLRLTGYSRREVLGRNCRFLQGPATDPQALARLRTAIAADPPAPVTVTLLNYRKDGAPFYNCLHIAPIRDAAGRVSYLAGIQLDVSRADASRGAAAAASAAASGGNADALLPQAPPAIGMQQKLVHNGVTGALRLAVRSVSGKADLRRSIDYQGLPVDRHTAMHHGSLHPHHSAPVPLPTASGNPCASEPQQEHLPQRSRSDLH